jgi:CHC2 zinc finger
MASQTTYRSDRDARLGAIDFDAIRARNPLAEYCQNRGIELRRNGGSGELVGLCPLHKEKTPSFHVYPDNHYYCYGCEAHGDVTDLEQALGGGTRTEAAVRLGAERTQSIRPLPKAEPEPVKPIYKLTKADRGLMTEATVALRRKPELALRVRENLPLEAVEQTAIEGDLGFCHELSFAGISRPALLFGYSHGIKARWPGKVIRWICGNAAGECWRQSLLLKSHHVVYFTEGEPDALSLIAQGYDVPGDSLVVGLASASTLPNSEPFAGKDLVLIPDTDDAGRQCGQRFRAALSPVARSVAVVDLIQSEGLNL